MASLNDKGPSRRFGPLLIATVAVVALAAIGVAMLLVNIAERKQEAKNTFLRVVEIDDTVEDPAIWGQNFPQHYDLYRHTADMARTRYGGSEAMVKSPTDADPRSVVARSKLEADPRLVTMWSGYAFAADYREKRGHAYMLEDQTFTGRQVAAKQAGACINCHASTYLAYKKLGEGDITKGFETINKMSYQEARTHVTNPVACIDCHEPASMKLRITRPSFIEGIKALKASQGVADYDVNRDASRQEMRSYVCGQCHVTYYFRGAEKRLFFPWTKGLRFDQIAAFENEDKVAEWTHKETGAPMKKARHPEFETWAQGIHARSGVACADCHMPYIRQGAMKISDHNVRSPVLNINAACQTCHRWPEAEIKGRVEEIQGRFVEAKDMALDALMDLIGDLKAARAAGATDAELQEARRFQREGQFYIDLLVSENSMGFHADQYAMKVFAEAVNYCRQGQLALRRDVKSVTVQYAPAASPSPPPAPKGG